MQIIYTACSLRSWKIGLSHTCKTSTGIHTLYEAKQQISNRATRRAFDQPLGFFYFLFFFYTVVGVAIIDRGN